MERSGVSRTSSFAPLAAQFRSQEIFGGTSFWVHDSSKLPMNLRSAEALLPLRP